MNRSQILSEQSVRNNQIIMAIVLQTNQATAAEEEQVFDKLQTARNDASLLLEHGDSYMDVKSFTFVFFDIFENCEISITFFVDSSFSPDV